MESCLIQSGSRNMEQIGPKFSTWDRSHPELRNAPGSEAQRSLILKAGAEGNSVWSELNQKLSHSSIPDVEFYRIASNPVLMCLYCTRVSFSFVPVLLFLFVCILFKERAFSSCGVCFQSNRVWCVKKLEPCAWGSTSPSSWTHVQTLCTLLSSPVHFL